MAHDRPLTPALAPGRTGTAGMMLVALAAVPLWSPRAPGAGPLAFAAVGLVLLLFSVGWVAMNRRSPHAGALYAVIARGLGRPVGVGAGWIALLAYTALQIGLYGRLGAAVGPLLRDWFAVSPPWWMVVAGCWLVVALCGLLRVQVVGALLGVLVLAEVAGLGVAGVLYARSDGTPLLSGTLLTSSYPALGPLLAGAALAFAGFETAAVYGEEARSPRRALPGSAYGVVAVAALLYAGVFPIAASSVPGRVVLVTGLLAGLIALHHTIARYLFALGRERLLPAALGRTARRTCAPRAGSLVQSLLAAVLLFGCWYAGGGIPTRLGAGGALAVLVLLVLASAASLIGLNREPGDENAWRRFTAPALAVVGVGTLGYLAAVNLPALLGPLVRTVPAVLAAALVLGVLHALLLRRVRPVVYAGIGRGGPAAVVTRALPRPREPGAHRPERINR